MNAAMIAAAAAAEAVVLQNEQIRVVCLPKHGMLVTEVTPAELGGNVLWSRDDSRLHAFERPALPTAEGDTFDDEVFSGGWFGMFPNAGIPGAEDRTHILHGTFSRYAWQTEECTPTLLRCSLEVDGLRAVRTLQIDGARVTMTTEATNLTDHVHPVSSGEHPCLSREVFAGGQVALEARHSFITPELSEPGANRFLPDQEFHWPNAREADGALGWVDQIPASAEGSHDHICVELATTEVTVNAPAPRGELALHIDTAATPYLLFWRHFSPPASPWKGDVFGLETMSTPGRTRDDARVAGALTELEPGESVRWSLGMQWRSTPEPTCS